MYKLHLYCIKSSWTPLDLTNGTRIKYTLPLHFFFTVQLFVWYSIKNLYNHMLIAVPVLHPQAYYSVCTDIRYAKCTDYYVDLASITGKWLGLLLTVSRTRLPFTYQGSFVYRLSSMCLGIGSMYMQDWRCLLTLYLLP